MICLRLFAINSRNTVPEVLFPYEVQKRTPCLSSWCIYFANKLRGAPFFAKKYILSNFFFVSSKSLSFTTLIPSTSAYCLLLSSSKCSFSVLSLALRPSSPLDTNQKLLLWEVLSACFNTALCWSRLLLSFNHCIWKPLIDDILSINFVDTEKLKDFTKFVDFLTLTSQSSVLYLANEVDFHFSAVAVWRVLPDFFEWDDSSPKFFFSTALRGIPKNTDITFPLFFWFINIDRITFSFFPIHFP